MSASKNGRAPGVSNTGGTRPNNQSDSSLGDHTDNGKGTNSCRRFTADDARLLVTALRRAAGDRVRVFAGRVGDPVCVRARYCCAAVGLEELIARSVEDDPRCPCAQRANWHPELVGVTK